MVFKMGQTKRFRWKAFFTKQFYLWHWVSSAIALVSMLLFAFTGITLNHAGRIQAEPRTTIVEAVLPEELLDKVWAEDRPRNEISAELQSWLRAELGVNVANRPIEGSEHDLYISLPRPGGDAWMEIDRESGTLYYESTFRGAISYLNDLHKGRHTGLAWSIFLDVFSVATIVVCITGLVLLFLHARRRPMTWPVVASGFLIPLLLIVFFVN